MMEETANPTPSATLAPEMPTTAVGENKANATSIKLLIKASNQQHDDQIIESDLMWTVYRLKTQLSLVYPSKPPVSEQKLIYSGQLLNDCAQLKDIIRSYKDVYTQNHILHLVYTPKNQPLQMQNPTKMTPTSNTTDGLRQRHNTATATTSSSMSNSSNNSNATASTDNISPQTNRHQLPTSTYGYLAPGLQQSTTTGGISGIFSTNNTATTSSTPFNGGFDMQNLAIQQAAMYNWMWQTYGQYMQQIHAAGQMSTAGSTNNTTHSTNPLNPVIAFPSLTPAAFFAQPYFSQQNQIQTSNAAAQSPPVEPLQEQQQQEQQEAEAAPPQPRFLNIVQEEQENRDWLDSFFSIMRLALFLTILYFNSSAIRCFMVFLIAGGIYLYHIGFFRMRQERNNNDINRNNNAAAAAEPVQQQDGQQQNEVNNDTNSPQNEQTNESAGVASDTSADSTNTNDAASIAAQDAVAVDNNSTSVIAFMRSFIVSFFTSLLPETPAAL